MLVRRSLTFLEGMTVVDAIPDNSAEETWSLLGIVHHDTFVLQGTKRS